MVAISKKEFLSQFKSVKSIIIIAILLSTSYFSASFAKHLLAEIELTAREAESAYSAGLLFLIFFFGLVFVMSLSHDVINRETHERTMRFLVTRTSRTLVLLGKFSGIWFFWFICLALSFLIMSLFSKKLDFFIFMQSISLITYFIALTMLFSVLVYKPGLSMFIGIITGLLFPILGLWAAYSTNFWAKPLKYLTPYYYLVRDDYTFLVIFLLAALMVLLAILLFKRREC
ncbi:hypothetical protein J9303_16460 [Bacillaceae bacterium Marseille-Q3522]|nr:hypothetical protein [Bacillaceae bacterium Marseille-Q3522]